MITPESLSVTTPTDREIVMTRRFDAPRPLVFDAMTKPDLLKRWLFGPSGWSLPICEVDLRVGGKYRYVWRHENKGTEMTAGGVFLEIDPPNRIVQSERFDDPWYEGECINTLVLTEEGGKTRLTLTMLFESREIRDQVMKSGMAGGVDESYSRLDAVLAELA